MALGDAVAILFPAIYLYWNPYTTSPPSLTVREGTIYPIVNRVKNRHGANSMRSRPSARKAHCAPGAESRTISIYGRVDLIYLGSGCITMASLRMQSSTV